MPDDGATPDDSFRLAQHHAATDRQRFEKAEWTQARKPSRRRGGSFWKLTGSG
jgi:hypothetical protein